MNERDVIERVLADAQHYRPARQEPAARPFHDGVVLVNGADLNPEPIAWLWQDWLAMGKLHTLAGTPGQGKTTIALSMAATVTTGAAWPDGRRCVLPGKVLIWSGEDDPADTLLPRLLAAGADRSRVYFVGGTRIDGEVCPFDPARDMTALRDAADRIGNVRMILVDPIASAVAGDSHKNTEVRRALQPLVDLAGTMNAALVGITHFSKGGQGVDPAQRVIGSVAFTAVARVVLVAAKVQGDDGEDRRILARGKSNIGPDDGGLTYALEQCEPLPGIHASRIVWGVQVKGTARELLAEPEQDTPAGSKSEAMAFLLERLALGTCPAKTLKQEAIDAGISWKSIRTASEKLGVRKTKGGYQGEWYWNLPGAKDAPKMPKEAQEAQQKNTGTLGAFVEYTGTFDVGGNHE